MTWFSKVLVSSGKRLFGVDLVLLMSFAALASSILFVGSAPGPFGGGR